MEAKEVTLIIPCRNEGKFIKKCLDSILAQDYPKNKLEVFVIDGMSEDGTRDIAESYTRENTFIKLLDNPKKVIPTAMNLGIKNAHSEIIMKIDSHAAYPKDYVSKCVKYLIECDADNVGGVIITLPRCETMFGKAIAIALAHPFGIGNSYFRLGCKEPRWADTAFSGCYRKEVFERIGLYDENIARSEDVGINSRLRKAGGRILLAPEIKAYYYARSNFSDFFRHNFDNGFWITYPLKFGRVLFSWRHLIPFLFIVDLMGSLSMWALTRWVGLSGLLNSLSLWLFLLTVVSYSSLNIVFSIKIAMRERDKRYLLIMPIIFASLHVGYGLGSLWGLLKVTTSKISWRNLKSALHGS